jgi:hypothetical protein
MVFWYCGIGKGKKQEPRYKNQKAELKLVLWYFGILVLRKTKHQEGI